jgi:ADP-dependent NAD(P)H-hydrate dehydratase / NAD(P)H-hydrate epimerase
MKIVSAETMSRLENEAYQQGCSEQQFMEAAGKGIANIADAFIQNRRLPKKVLLLCGKGNNGGDAFVAGRYLLYKGYQVFAILPELPEKCSPLCQKNAQQFLENGGLISLKREAHLFNTSLILDGLFGTGFKGKIGEPYASLIHQANYSRVPILAIDIPSGLNGSTGQVEGPAIYATETIFLGLPKLGFFLQNGWNYAGQLRWVDFGLPPALVQNVKADFELIMPQTAHHMIPPIKRNRHKYQAGYVVGLAGSPAMPGAALLSSLAALRGGCGMMNLLYPKGMESQLANSPYEIIKTPYTYKDKKEILSLMQKGSASFIGPGLGRTVQVANLLKKVIPSLEKPCVMDADALNLFAEIPFPLPKQVIFTPHAGEMQRLLNKFSTPLTLDSLLLCREYVEKHNITLILKGAPTFIFHPQSPILINSTGDPGMATAGSGDVLTGLLASLLAQGLKCKEAAIVGVYLHGLAGTIAAQQTSSYTLIASDIISHFFQAYRVMTLLA